MSPRRRRRGVGVRPSSDDGKKSGSLLGGSPERAALEGALGPREGGRLRGGDEVGKWMGDDPPGVSAGDVNNNQTRTVGGGGGIA